MSLSIGALLSILNDVKLEKPIFRISNMKKVIAEKGPAKIRLILTDGQTSHSFVMLASTLNDRVDSGEIAQDSIIQLDNYILKTQADKKIIMIMELTVITHNIENVAPVQTIMNPTVTKLSRPSMLSSSNMPTIDISFLNPYQNKWSIKGRVIKKDSIRTWNNQKGEGKLFNFTMLDDTCDVKVTCFNQEVDKFHDLIEVDKTYILTKGLVKVADRRFNSTKCDHEITLKPDSEITQVEDDLHIPAMIYSFVDLARLKDCSPNSVVDVIGVAHEIKDTTTIITKKANKEISKRDVVLVDRSGSSVNLTLWSEDVKLVDNIHNPVIVVRGACMNDFNGLSLSVGFNSTIKINPDNIPEAGLLLGWYNAVGRENAFAAQSGGSGSGSFTSKKATISELACTSGDKSDFYMVEAIVASIKKDNLVYKACSKCNKKLLDHNNGLYGCLKCSIDGPDFKYRLMLNANIMDYTGNLYLTVFQESAEKLLGISADEIGNMLETGQKEEVEKIISDAIYKEDLMCKVRVSNETYNDETRMKAVLSDWSVTDNKEAITTLLSELS